MEHEYIKSMIQEALWNEYKRTGNEDYKIIYEKWYENYEKLDLSVLCEVEVSNKRVIPGSLKYRKVRLSNEEYR